MRENHFCRAHHPSPATHRAPGIRVRGVPVLLQFPDNPLPGGRWGQPHQREPWPRLGGCSPSPALGHQQEHSWIHPAPGEDGLGHHLSPKSCTLLLIPPMTLGKLCLFGCMTQTHRDPLTPGEMLQLKCLPFLPREMPSAAEQPRSREQRHRICSQLEMLSERGWNLIKAEPESRLRRCGCCACQMNFM